jgi:hypothetical protein
LEWLTEFLALRDLEDWEPRIAVVSDNEIGRPDGVLRGLIDKLDLLRNARGGKQDLVVVFERGIKHPVDPHLMDSPIVLLVPLFVCESELGAQAFLEVVQSHWEGLFESCKAKERSRDVEKADPIVKAWLQSCH